MPRVCSPPHGVQQPDDCLKAQEVSGDSGGERVDRTLLCTRPYAEVRSLSEMTFNAFTTKRVSGWGKMTERTTSWPAICAVRNAAPFGSSEYANFTSWSLGLTFVHSSCMTLPFGLTDVQFLRSAPAIRSSSSTVLWNSSATWRRRSTRRSRTTEYSYERRPYAKVSREKFFTAAARAIKFRRQLAIAI